MVSLFSDSLIGLQVENFEFRNHNNKSHYLSSQMGKKGLLLGFSGNIWDLSSVRQVLWLHRQSYKLALHNLGTAVIVPNEPYELSGFFMSIPRDITFPLLSDNRHQAYDMLEMNERSGFVLLNAEYCVVRRWFTDDIVPSVRDVIATAER